jgi:hypothetical protein
VRLGIQQARLGIQQARLGIQQARLRTSTQCAVWGYQRVRIWAIPTNHAKGLYAKKKFEAYVLDFCRQTMHVDNRFFVCSYLFTDQLSSLFKDLLAVDSVVSVYVCYHY